MDPLLTWMTNVDRALLEYMAEHPDLALPPKVWTHNINQEVDISYSQICKRLWVLRDLDRPMVEQDPERGDAYTITEFGLKVVEGDVDVDVIRELEPED